MGMLHAKRSRNTKGGTYYESTTLQFTTTDEIRQSQQLAFVVTDVNNHTYVIGCKEAPYPVVDITTKVDDETNISEVKVTFQRQKSLIPLRSLDIYY